jgi:hypothetical protein
MNDYIYKGGSRECIILNSNTVEKRYLRMLSTPDFDIIDDFLFDGIDQQVVESESLNYIMQNAPDEVKKFFPRLFGIQKKKLNKPTFSSSKLEKIYQYQPTLSTTLVDLTHFPAAKLDFEIVLILERITPFEEIPIQERKSFLQKGVTFETFSKHYGATVDELNFLAAWLKEKTLQNYWKLDYQYTVSNWGLRPVSRQPVILDLGYFFLQPSIYIL